VLKVNCWGRTWGPLKTTLGRQGIILEPGVVVSLRGRVEFYPPKGQINFIASDVDVTALLGRLAARRAALLNTLESEGLLRRNQALAVPAVPLRIGLVASLGSEGYNDFVGQLQGSDLAFSVILFKANVQGAGAPASIARALRALSGSDCDVGVLVRGGGSRGDLAAFDAEPVARAIAALPIPLWTGIGHTGDRSVADIVANEAFVTPTACAQELVRRVGEFWESAAGSGARIGRRAADTLQAASLRDATARRRLGTATRNQLSRHTERLERRVAQIATNARRQLDFAGDSVQRRTARVGPRAASVLDRHQDRADTWRRLLAAYDIERQLERGYTITLRPDGNLVRSVADLDSGSPLITRFADGRASSIVDGTEPRSTTEGQR
jgi:exodeoxyribonuclease VII large subunit